MKKEAKLYDKLPDNRVACGLCAHHCVISDSAFGVCGVRKNENGTLFTLGFGELIAAHIDPVEKKPLYHFLPGSQTYSIAAAGCNFKCSFCQNWQISQLNYRHGDIPTEFTSPESVVKSALESGCKSISYTYTEPTIFFEYAMETAELAKESGLENIFVTNGYMTEAAIKEIKPFLGAANIDLKSFSDDFYRKICKGTLKPVLDSITAMVKHGIWVEITTLIIPGLNDSPEELAQIARFIAQTGKEIPWHISRFHPDFQMSDTPQTPHKTLESAVEAGKKAGLKYIYMGNVADGSDTLCPKCGITLIKRDCFAVISNKLKGSNCPACGTKIDGI